MTQKEFDKKPYWLCIENVRSAYNVGAMLRSADGTGIFGVITIGYTPLPSNIKVKKTALGAEDVVPWLSFKSSKDFLNILEREQLENNLFSLELVNDAISIFSLSKNQIANPPVFFVVGNEVQGVSAKLLVASRHLYIPMHGVKESLNVAESASILMYEIYRKGLK